MTKSKYRGCSNSISSVCVLIDPRPVKKDLREFQGNPYPQETFHMGFHKEEMAIIDEWLLTENPVLVFD